MPEQAALTCAQCGDAFVQMNRAIAAHMRENVRSLTLNNPGCEVYDYGGLQSPTSTRYVYEDMVLLCSSQCRNDAVDDNLLMLCEDCQELVPAGGTVTSEGYWVCEGCAESYAYCLDCDEFYTRDGMTYFGDEGGHRCDHCIDMNCVECDACENMYHSEHISVVSDYNEEEEDLITETHDISCDAYICRACYRSACNAQSREDRYIQYYTYQPREMMVRRYGSKDGIEVLNITAYRGLALSRVENYFGMELEVEPDASSLTTATNVMEAAKWVTELGGDKMFYCKRDGSVPHGFEIVSHPASFDWWMGLGSDLLSQITEAMRNEFNFTSHVSGRCGLHIHTNKPALGHIQCKRMVEFMYDHRRKSWLNNLSRRNGEDDYAHLDFDTNRYSYRTNNRNERLTLSQAATALAKNYKRGGDRCNALNMSNDNTAELRLFRGTLNTDSLLASFQFFMALIEVCDPKGSNPGMAPPTLTKFKRYIKDNSKKYEKLITLLEGQGLCA